ncbi:MAG: hypothetical protein Q9220_007474 [cf. Caloplaca sp. 1 TL-2023]
MASYKIALLSLLANTISAVPHYGQHGHLHHPVHHKSGSSPSGVYTSGFPTAGPIAPYGQGNSTTIASTGTAPLTSSVAPVLSTVTVVPQPVSSGGSGNSPVDSSSAGGECGPATVTVTTANTITVTVGAGPSTSAADSSDTSSAPLETSSSTGETSLPAVIPLPVLPTPLESSTKDKSPETATAPTMTAPTTTADVGAQFYQAPTTEVVAPTTTASKVDYSPEEATTSATPKTSVTPSTDNVVPRGLVYNEASLVSLFDSSTTGWLYNWDSSPGGTVPTSKEFIPMLWNTSEVYHTPHWQANADAAIAAGSKHLLAFNEPDLSAQANMDVGECVEGWNTYMEPFHTKYNGDVKLGSPSVCNGPDQNQGLAFLTSFLKDCGGCHIDFLAIHWYGEATDDGVQNLKDHIGKTQAMANGRPIWLTEFQPSGSDEQQSSFLDQVLPWLDDKSNGVDRYAYFKVDTMVNGAQLTQAGKTYAA